MIKRIYFVSAVIKNNGAVRKHFHSNLVCRSWFPKYIKTETLVDMISKQEFMVQGDIVLLTAFNRIK